MTEPNSRWDIGLTMSGFGMDTAARISEELLEFATERWPEYGACGHVSLVDEDADAADASGS